MKDLGGKFKEIKEQFVVKLIETLDNKLEQKTKCIVKNMQNIV